MGEVVLLSVAFRIIKENLSNATLSIIAGGYSCNFLRYIPWVDEAVPIERFGVFMGRTTKVKRLLYRPFIVPMLSRFLRKGVFDCVFIRDDERLPYTSLIRTAVERSDVKNVVILRPLMQKHFDSSRHVIESYLAILKELSFTVIGDERPVLSLSDDGFKNAKSFLYKHGISKDTHKIVGLCPTSNMKIKNWDAEKISILVEKLSRDQHIKILLFTTDQEYTKRLSRLSKKHLLIVGYLPFGDLISLISQCELFISVDTGPMHVAAALDIPTIGIFGPTSGKMFGPYGKDCLVLQNTPDCPYYRPAAFFLPDEKEFQLCYIRDSCQIMEKACTDLVSSEEAFAAAKSILPYSSSKVLISERLEK